MKDWSGQNVLIIGVARQGTALARYLSGKGAQVVLNDHHIADQFKVVQKSLSDLPIKWVFGGHPLSLLDGMDLVCPSGGVPLDIEIIVEAKRRGIPLSNDSQIFLESAPCEVIGITGSAGKTTTTTLVGRIAEEGVKEENEISSSILHPSKVWVGGNIGNPLIQNLDEVHMDDLVVMELSSFQLEIMTCSPDIAAILNITPNHLDRHGTMEAYTRAKARILDFQDDGDKAVLGWDDPVAWGLADSVRGSLVSFGLGPPPEGYVGCFLDGENIVLWDGNSTQELFSKDMIRLRGSHNLENVLAACAIAFAAGLPTEAMQAGIDDFSGVPHRLEFVRSWGGADWYNDSIATAPERAIAAIRAFEEPLVLLLGGRDKELPWRELAALVSRRVNHVILFGEAAPLIERAIRSQMNTGPLSIRCCSDLKQAVQSAAEVIEPGDVVLLSPGGTSFDAFHDFAERGEKYRLWVNELN